MFGILAFLFQIAFVLWPLGFLIAGLVSIRKRQADWRTWVSIIMLPFISLLWVSVLGVQLYHESANYMFLATLPSENVDSISIGDTRWDDQENVRSIVTALNNPVWHVVNHDVGGPFQPLTITLRSGQIVSFRIGRYYGREGAIIQFYRTHGNGTWEDGDVFVPELTSLLEELGYVLPAYSQ